MEKYFDFVPNFCANINSVAKVAQLLLQLLIIKSFEAAAGQLWWILSLCFRQSMMRKPNKFRQAPLASFESFLSLETDEREESREMRELHWNFTNNNHQQMSSHPPDLQHPPHNQLQFEEKCLDEPWLTSEFSQMTRKQQNCEIYRVRNYIKSFVTIFIEIF